MLTYYARTAKCIVGFLIHYTSSTFYLLYIPPIYCACSFDMLRHLNNCMHKLFKAEMGGYILCGYKVDVTLEVFTLAFIITIMDTHPSQPSKIL